VVVSGLLYVRHLLVAKMTFAAVANHVCRDTAFRRRLCLPSRVSVVLNRHFAHNSPANADTARIVAPKWSATPIEPAKIGKWSATPIEPAKIGKWSAKPIEPAKIGKWSAKPIEPAKAGKWSAKTIEPARIGKWSATPIEPAKVGKWSATPIEPAKTGKWSATPIEPAKAQNLSATPTEPAKTRSHAAGPVVQKEAEQPVKENEADSAEEDAPAAFLGIITAFHGSGWPMVQLGKSGVTALREANVQLPTTLTGQLVVMAAPLSTGAVVTPLMRMQRVRVDWSSSEIAVSENGDGDLVAVPLEALSWRVVAVAPAQKVMVRCIHPNRVASLCLNCPRRKGGKSKARKISTAAVICSHGRSFGTSANDEEDRWKRGLEVIDAIKVKDEDLAEELLAGADLTATDDFGSTALILAARSGLCELCSTLLESEAVEVDTQNHFGSTALICAATNGHLEVCEMLLQRGADVNIRTRLGGTALGKAASSGQTLVCERLLRAGAAVDVRTKLDQTASDLAFAAGHDDLAKRLTVGME